MSEMNLEIESRPVYAIKGDYRTWRYFTLHAALRKLAFRKLAKRYPVEYDPGDWSIGLSESYDSEISFDRRIKIVERFVRRWKPAAKRAMVRKAEAR